VTGLLTDETKTLTATAKTAAYVDAVAFKFTKEGNPAELLRNLTLSVLYGSRTDDISDVGTGTQSAVIIGMLELALRHRAAAGIHVFCVEEPELFLHPHAQRRIAALLRELATDKDNFLLITSHSPEIVLGSDIEDIYRIERGPANQTRVCNVKDPEAERELQRKLARDSAEMVFADRAILVEGESEPNFLPLISRLMSDPNGLSCDYDSRNVSVVRVQGKKSFKNYVKAIEGFGIEWRAVTDNDALDDNSLAFFLERAGVEATVSSEDKRTELRNIGIGVLSQGEIEDYFPHGALAAIAGCAESEVSNKIAEHRKQQSGAIRKTGDALKDWLRPRTKPEIARLVADWLQENPTRLPDNLKKLILWTVQ
jgi:Overcoming lysogenization defect protein-like, TOPRIM domain/AAA ATPase domain